MNFEFPPSPAPIGVCGSNSKLRNQNSEFCCCLQPRRPHHKSVEPLPSRRPLFRSAGAGTGVVFDPQIILSQSSEIPHFFRPTATQLGGRTTKQPTERRSSHELQHLSPTVVAAPLRSGVQLSLLAGDWEVETTARQRKPPHLARLQWAPGTSPGVCFVSHIRRLSEKSRID